MISVELVNFGSSPINYIVELSDGTDSDQAGYLQIDVSVDPSGSFGATGDINGFFVGFEDSVSQSQIDAIVNLAPPQTAAGPTVTWFGDDVTAVFAGAAGGCNNLNGAGGVPAAAMDIGFTLGTCGSSGGGITSSTLYLQGVLIGDIQALGGRVQSVVPAVGDDSSKLWLGTIPPPGPSDEIPEPATVTLMGAGLLGLMYFRRRKNS